MPMRPSASPQARAPLAARARALALALAATLAPAVAHAAGTHFFLEGSGGAALAPSSPQRDSRPLALGRWGLDFGVGGKLGRGNPTRLFALVGVTDSRWSENGAFPASGSLTEARFGVRALWPLVERLRLHVDAGFGPTFIHTDVDTGGPREIGADATRWGGFFAVGLQYRFVRALSVGVKTDMAFLDASGLVLEQSFGGLDPNWRAGLVGTLTVHF